MCRSFLSVHILFTKHAVLLLRIPLYYFNANSIIDIKIKSTKTRFFFCMDVQYFSYFISHSELFHAGFEMLSLTF